MLIRRFLALVSLSLLSVASACAADPANETLTPVSKSGNWMTRHESFNARVKQGNVDVLFIGDSITAAWENEGKEVWAKHFAPLNAVNLGIGGDRTQHVLWRLDHGNIDGISPKLAVIMIGTNNSADNTPEEIAAGITAIVQKLRTQLRTTKILLLGIFPRGPDNNDPRRKVNEATGAIIAKLANGPMIEYLDLGPRFLDADGTLSPEVMPDRLHLSPLGYEIWADGLLPHVNRMLEPASKNLQKKISVNFRRTPLQVAFAEIGAKTGVPFVINGDALKLAGYTQNMPQTFQMDDVPALDVVEAILKHYDKMRVQVGFVAEVTTEAVTLK